MEPIRLITFHVGSQLLALPLDQVREVIRNVAVTQLAAWAGLLHGIVNIRGTVIPILDLRQILGEKPENTRRTRIIITEMLGRNVGLVVDQVDDIVPLSPEQMIPLSMLALEKKPAILVAIANVENRSYLVLDVKQLVREEERALFKDVCLRLQDQLKHLPQTATEPQQ